MKYVYPALMKKEGKGFSVYFPDIEEAVTCGDDLYDAIIMGRDVLCIALFDREIENRPIPEPTRNPKCPKDTIVTYIECDTQFYRDFEASKPVKKTLNVQSWINKEATARGVNFTEVLNEALKKKLGY